MALIQQPYGSDGGRGRPWALTPSGVLAPMPAHPLSDRRLTHADTVLKYWKVQMSAADLLGPAAGLARARLLLSGYAIAATMDILSRAALVLAHGSYHERMATQRYLAQQFFPTEILHRADSWIRANRRDGEAYLFSEQQLLLAMCMTLLHHKGARQALPTGQAFEVLGEALLQTTYELDPLEAVDARTGPEVLTDQQRRLYVEFILRRGIFYGEDDHRYAIARYHELFRSIAPALVGDPDFVDIPAVFKRATGLTIDTYLAMGIGVLSPLRQITRDNADRTSAILKRSQLFSTSNVSQAARRFFKAVATNRRSFRRAMRVDLQRYGNLPYNFLEAERHPLVEIANDRICCLSVRFLERKFGSGMHHMILDALPEAQRLRYFSFFGRVFEHYVQQTFASIHS